jgi:hypothetical protein
MTVFLTWYVLYLCGVYVNPTTRLQVVISWIFLATSATIYTVVRILWGRLKREEFRKKALESIEIAMDDALIHDEIENLTNEVSQG